MKWNWKDEQRVFFFPANEQRRKLISTLKLESVSDGISESDAKELRQAVTRIVTPSK